MPVFKDRSMEVDGKMKVVHWNMLLPLFSNPSDHTNKSDTESMSAVTSHVQNMSACSRVRVANCNPC